MISTTTPNIATTINAATKSRISEAPSNPVSMVPPNGENKREQCAVNGAGRPQREIKLSIALPDGDRSGVEPTSSRGKLPPLKSEHVFTAHDYNSYQRECLRRADGGLPNGVFPPPMYQTQASLCAIASTGSFFQSEKYSLMSFCSKRCSSVAVTMQVRRLASPSA